MTPNVRLEIFEIAVSYPPFPVWVTLRKVWMRAIYAG